MKSFDDWMNTYADSHQHPLNKKIHNICVPLIFFITVALIWKISFLLLIPLALLTIGFYYTIGKKVANVGAGIIGASLLIQILFGFGFIFLILLLAAAWAGLVYGHKLEGVKPSILASLLLLLIGPLYVFYPVIKKAGYDIQS